MLVFRNPNKFLSLATNTIFFPKANIFINEGQSVRPSLRDRGKAAVDVFTCGERDSRKIAEFFCTAIDNGHIDVTVVER